MLYLNNFAFLSYPLHIPCSHITTNNRQEKSLIIKKTGNVRVECTFPHIIKVFIEATKSFTFNFNNPNPVTQFSLRPVALSPEFYRNLARAVIPTFEIRSAAKKSTFADANVVIQSSRAPPIVIAWRVLLRNSYE